MTFSEQPPATYPLGSLDGDGAADHDQPYTFGWRPRTSVTYPFSTRQYARLLILRSRLKDETREVRDTAKCWCRSAAA
jgi:hypothetical protein